MLLKYSQIRKVKIPSRGHSTDAGIDFCCPSIDGIIKDMKENRANENVSFESNPSSIVIPPGENAVIPSGIKVEIPYGHMGLFLNKSGVASKKDLIVGAAVIDCFYSGEVHIDLHNIGKKEIHIEEGTKLAQMVIVPILSCDLTEVEEDMLYDWMKQDSHRDESGFGSTGS